MAKTLTDTAGVLKHPRDAASASDTDERDFLAIYEANRALVRSLIYQIAGPEALDDLVQEAFVRIWQKLPSFRGEAKMSSWIYRVCANLALDYCRGRSRRSAIESRDESPERTAEYASSAPSPEIQTEHQQLIREGLAALSEDHRTVLVLALLHELPLAEIAEVLSVSEGTIKSRLFYAKAEFRRFLSAKGVQTCQT